MYSRILKEPRSVDRHCISRQLNHIICQTDHSRSSRIIFLILGRIIPSWYASAIIQISRSVIVNQHSRIKQPLHPLGRLRTSTDQMASCRRLSKWSQR